MHCVFCQQDGLEHDDGIPAEFYSTDGKMVYTTEQVACVCHECVSEFLELAPDLTYQLKPDFDAPEEMVAAS